MDLILVSDENEEWVKNKTIRRLWHLDLISILIGLALFLIALPAVEETWGDSARVMLVCRLIGAFTVLWLILLNVSLAWFFYRHLLMAGLDLRFTPIFWYWLVWVLLLGALYAQLYCIKPSLFVFPDAPYIPASTFTHPQPSYFLRQLLVLKFYLYSACTAFTVSDPEISSASPSITGLNLVETIGNTLLLVVLVATFIHKSVLLKHQKD